MVCPHNGTAVPKGLINSLGVSTTLTCLVSSLLSTAVRVRAYVHTCVRRIIRTHVHPSLSVLNVLSFGVGCCVVWLFQSEECTIILILTPSRTTVSFWGQTTQNSSSLSSKRDCGATRINTAVSSFCFVPSAAVDFSCELFYNIIQASCYDGQCHRNGGFQARSDSLAHRCLTNAVY